METSRSALNIILRRLDKSVAKIAKKSSVRKRANWNAVACWLNGLYQTLVAYPYIAHLHPLKTITQMCLRLVVGDHFADEAAGPGLFSAGASNTILSSAVPPAGFCAVVLKLTAFMMQALGQFSFSLELICSHDGIGASAERLEAVLCHVVIPLCLMAAVPGKEAPQLQAKDLVFCLNLMHHTVSPPLTKQPAAPLSGSALATSLIRGAVASAHSTDAAGRQGSISVTDKGHSATVSAHRVVRESAIQAIFLGECRGPTSTPPPPSALKVLLVAFHRQMTSHWIKVARIMKDIASKKLGGPALFNFVEFLAQLNLPISLLVIPIIQQKVAIRDLFFICRKRKS